jgi:hypothetical protein
MLRKNSFSIKERNGKGVQEEIVKKKVIDKETVDTLELPQGVLSLFNILI